MRPSAPVWTPGARCAGARRSFRARWRAAAFWLVLLNPLTGGAALAGGIHGENSSFAGHGIILAWGILKARVEDQSQVIVRVTPVDPAYTYVGVDGVDPFTQKRQEVLAVQPLSAEVDVRSARGTFADFPRREFHFFTASDWLAKRPSLTVYYMGVPDTTPEFLAEEALLAYLAGTVDKLRTGARRTP